MEGVLEPDHPVVEARHPLWDRPEGTYLLAGILAGIRAATGDGHPIAATVYIQCRSVHRSSGPAERSALFSGTAMHIDNLDAGELSL